MTASRKPKKIFVQFAIALVVAVIFGAAAIFAGFMVIQAVSSNAEQVQKEAEEKVEAAKAEQEKYLKLQEQLSQVPRSYKVVQALTDLNPGQPITKDMITLVDVNDRPTPGTLDRISQAVGKVVKSPVMSGEALDNTRLIDTGGLFSVEPGKRAITIRVDSIGGLSGALAPGAHVDVLTTVNQEDTSITRTLLQNIPVVSMGGGGGSASNQAGLREAEKTNAGGGNLAVTLIVSPRQAELLTLAGQLGGFHLTLRNFSDHQKQDLAGADLTALMTGLQPAATKKALPASPKPAARESGFHNVNYSGGDSDLPQPSAVNPSGPKFTMQVYRGTGSETIDFQP
ncbi:Flp pilus assembly protein CpaB [Vampirovibrio sp.]|uniref:Flp pilus assembly protein CpaB n=1 Tax=Vampirovibrio sp. TaxID=2717857 RepID=UPI003592FEE2